MNNAAPREHPAFLIVTYNGDQHIEHLLTSIPVGSRVVIVDNASTDTTLTIAAGFSTRLDLDILSLETNRGYAAGINAGMERIGSCADLSAEASAKAEWVFVLNQDIVVNAPFEKGGWGDLQQRLGKDYSGYAVVQPRILLPDGTINVDELRMNVWGFVYPPDYATTPKPKDPKETLLFSGAAFLLNVAKYQQIGPFDESLFMYYEDVDYALRLRAQRQKVLFDPTWTVTHSYHPSTSSARKMRALLKNRSIIMARYASPLHQLLSLSSWPTKTNKKIKYSPPNIGGGGGGITTDYRLPTTDLLLGFHSRQIPQPLRLLVNLLAIPGGCLLKTILAPTDRVTFPTATKSKSG